ncbi:DNA-dependent protein kinase catalytic subunit-like [Amphiura filiformis]|uniref:DNA-dependent protein kinase catalytic subunit-like n=1 Tax=Amphiura filiformis TaxID=82378 RepID=UPI003B20B70B
MDFQVFINLVEFCRELLPSQQLNYFEQWVYPFGHQLILLSSQLPLVSGFYKMLTICMDICCKISYFKDIYGPLNQPDDYMEVDSQATSGVTTSDRQASFLLFAKFTKEVLVRLKQYKDDLLASCLFFVLSLPHEIVHAEVISVVPALQTTFKIGVSYLPLAESGLTALNSWLHHLPMDTMRPHFNIILPLLDDYLRATSEQGSTLDTLQTVFIKPGKFSGKRSITGSKLVKNMEKQQQIQDSPLKTVQLKILHFLGSLGGQTNASLLETSTDEIAKEAVAWDIQPRLQFAVPFVDMKPNINLDTFLPRVVELALTSGDRQTKVAACESLHTLVLYMLGKGTQQPEQRQAKSPMQRLYRHIFPALLQLACDVEQVARQLFEPLVMQLIHWFTGNKKFESEETSTFLNAMQEGVMHPTDTALRDFSARCLKEFLRWSIKQTSKKQQEKSPINAKSLLKRLYSMALHPNAFKRLGAALAFNNIYTVFREEPTLVDQFAFEILVTYVHSLALAHHDDKALGTQEQGVEVLKHLERIIRVKADMLNKETKNRRTPRDFANAPNLSYMTVWLLQQCGRPQTECRHQCMTLVFKLATLLPGKNTAQTWMQNTLKEKGADYFVSRFEGGGGRSSSKSGIAKYPSLVSMSQSVFSVKMACNWFDLLLAALDCYTWVFGEKLLVPSVLFTDAARKPSSLFQSIQYYVSNIAMSDLKTVSQRTGGTTHHVFTPREVEQFNRSKCTVAVRLMDFLMVLLGNYPTEAVKVLPASLWKGKLLDLVIACVLEPTAVGFNMADVEVMSNLPRTTGQLLSLLSTRLPAAIQADLKRAVSNRIKQSQQNLFKLLPSVFHGDQEDLDHAKLMHLVIGYEQLHQAGLMVAAIDKEDLDHAKLMHLVIGYEQLHQAGLMVAAIDKPNTPLESLSSQILVCVYDGLARKDSDGKLVACELSPTAVDLGDRLLKLAFKMGVQPKLLVANLGKDTKLATSSATTISDLNLTHGMAFYSTFRSTINEELAAHAQQAIPPLIWDASRSTFGSVLNGLLDHVATNRELRKKHGKAVHSIILTKWDTVTGGLRKGCGQDLQSFVLLLLRKLLQIDSNFCSKPSHPTYQHVFSAYVIMLTDPATSLTFKAQVMDILYFFTSAPDQDHAIKDALNCLIADNFPLKSSEFRVGSPKYNDYIAALNKILTAMVLSGSLLLLEILISIMCREERHIYEDEIQSTLASFIKRLPVPKQTEAFMVAYKVFQEEDNYPMEIRRQAIERICIPLMRLCSTHALVEFFKANIKKIIGTIEARTIKAPEMAFESQLVSKMCCFQLLEIMYSRLTKEDLNSPQSDINKAYCDGSVKDGKEMTRAVTKASHAAKSEDTRGETTSLELRRQYHCSAYNALVAIITCTQTELKFYNAFLFNENLTKGQFLLDNIMDSNKVYTFELEQDAPIQRKKKFVSIRSQIRGAAGDGSESGDSGFMSTYTMGPGKYMSTQYLSESSLSEEISVFDYAGGIPQFSSSLTEREQTQGSAGRTKSDASQEQPSSIVHGEYMELESDELNQHECMASVTAVLKHMHSNKITPHVAEGSRPSEMPEWMSKLHKKLASTTSINVKLFIARLLINNDEMFEPYAKFWLGSLLELILTLGEFGLNYMILDIVVICLTWSPVAIPQERRLANKVLEFLMAHCHHETRKILRNNLDMVKTMVECWKPIVEVPSKVIYNSMIPKYGDKKDSAVGVQLLGVILANKLHPINPNSDVEEGRFYATLCANLTNRYKIVHAAAGEVVGMAMKQMAEVDKINDGSLHEEVHKHLNTLSMNQQVIFITCLHKIHLHYPVFADRFTNKLLFMLPSIHGQPKTLCLEVIGSRIEHITNAFLEVKNKGIIELLTHRDEEAQLVALKLVNGMLASLKPTELMYLLPSVRSFIRHPSPACREVMYDILMWVYDNYRDEEARQEEGADDVLAIAKDTLLQGLSDEEPTHRLRVSNFWSHETRLPTGTLDRMVAMLECMYSPSTEHQYLSYATSLLLEMTSKSPDYKREVFEHPLSECKFEDITIDHSWKKRNLAISTPMFVETQASQSSSGSGGSQSQTGSDNLSGQVRATQDVQQFTATQDLDAIASRKNAYNWLTGSQDTFADYSASLGTEQSSLLFTIGASSKKTSKVSKRAIPTQAVVGAGFGQQRLRPDQQDETDSGSVSKRAVPTQAVIGAGFGQQRLRPDQQDETDSGSVSKRAVPTQAVIGAGFGQQRLRPDQQDETDSGSVSKRAIPTQAVVGAGFGQQRLKPDQQDETDSGSGGRLDKDVLRLKKRFLKDQAASSAFFMKRAVRQKQMIEESLKEQRERRFAVVTMYRRYRSGDLPDIQIKYADLIAPLQALAQRDASLARLLFTALFNGIFAEIEETKTEREAAKLVKDINQHLNVMMSSSTQFYPPFISCVQEVSYHQSKQLTLEPSSISTASLTSQQLLLGVRLLEENLIQKTWEDEKAPKRARMATNEPTEEISTWIELARLYKALGEFDVLQGIFGGRIGTREITKVSLEAEARGDFKKALEKYTEAIETDWGEGNVQQVEEDLWDESRLHCCEQLTQWKDLEDYAILNIDEQDPPDLEKIWSDPYYQEHYLPAMMRGKLKQLLEGGDDESLLQFIDAAMQNQERRAYLEARHSEELAALYTIQEDYNRAKFYINKCMHGFLQDWCGLGKLMTSSRLAKLQGIQRLTEAQQFLELMTNAGVQGRDGCFKAQKLFDQWQGCYPDSKRDPISVWDDVVLNRCLYMDKAAGRFVQSLSQDTATLGAEETRFEDGILRERLSLGLMVANSACEQSNFSVAQKHLKNTYRSLSGHEELKPLWTHSYVRMHQKKAVLLQPNDRVTTILTTFDPLAKLTNQPALTSDPSLTQTHHVLTSKSYELVGLAVQDGGSELVESLRDAGKLDKLLDYAGRSKKQPHEIARSLLSEAHTQLKQAVRSADDVADQTKNKDSITAAYMAFVSFCDNILRQKDMDDDISETLPDTDSYPASIVKYTLQAMRYQSVEAMQRFPRLLVLFSLSLLDDDTSETLPDTDSYPASIVKYTLQAMRYQSVEAMQRFPRLLVLFSLSLLDDDTSETLPDTDSYPASIVKYTLQAMRYQSVEAMQRFPRLLQLVETYPDVMDLMIKQASTVPCWMFISWISQMMALLDKPEAPSVQGILAAIADDYPQALCYQFKISSEDYMFSNTPSDKRNLQAVEKLRGVLENVPMIENFIKALEQLNNPDMIYKDWWDDVMKPLLKDSKRDRAKVKKAYQEFYTNLLDYRASQSTSRGDTDSQSQSVAFGNVRRRFAQDYQKKFDAAFGKDGAKIVNMEYKTFHQNITKLNNEIKRKDSPGNIKEYCTWLSDFQSQGYDRELEIPGQYDGKTKPMPEYHVKIAGFDEYVKVLSSIRKPKMITIRGNDEKDYQFLVKGGEDLRLDQRVEQLFCIMNDILQQDSACSQRGLRLVTYQVIAMTPRLGMIEWVKNTTTLKDFLEKAMTEQELHAYRSVRGPKQQHNIWVDKHGGTLSNKNSHGPRYGGVYNRANFTETVKSFRQWESLVPWDLLRRAFLQMSASPEAFHTLRTHFARSHATVCICQYLLGIGDRHLSNFLVSLETGGMVGIDFGHAFGSATQFLPVPELMPFRLTRQIVNLMLPFKKEGLLQNTMVHTLRALRQNHELLINTMDVFVKEPSLDWKKNAQKQADVGQGQADPDDVADSSWFPKEKVKYARLKLEGANPTYITRFELKLGHSTNKAFKAFQEVVKGDVRKSVRASKPDTGLSVEQQVDCLIEQATDPNILGRVYLGWEAWM